MCIRDFLNIKYILTGGRIPLSLPRLEELGVEGLLYNLSWVGEGGTWSPVNDQSDPCIPRHRVAVIVPYR